MLDLDSIGFSRENIILCHFLWRRCYQHCIYSWTYNGIAPSVFKFSMPHRYSSSTVENIIFKYMANMISSLQSLMLKIIKENLFLGKFKMSITNSHIDLFFPTIIFELCVKAEVVFRDNEEWLKPMTLLMIHIQRWTRTKGSLIFHQMMRMRRRD